MKVKKLIELLKNEDPERIVLMASDPEGNFHDELNSFFTCAYKWNDGQLEIGLEKLTKQEEKAGYSDEDVLTGGKKALVLSP